MPRVARIAFPSMLYHVMSRGNNRERVFQGKEDFDSVDPNEAKRVGVKYEARMSHAELTEIAEETQVLWRIGEIPILHKVIPSGEADKG